MMKRISKILGFGIYIIKQLNWPARIFLIIFFVLIFTAVSVEVTSQPGFCNSCHIMNTFYASWKVSEHSEVNCLDCHLQPGFTGYVKGKLNGLAQLVDCVVGRVGTKPSAFVFDKSCLRSECHSVEELISEEVDFNDVKFNHDKHINTQVNGVTITCGLCHSHFEGEEHFKVNNDSCYICHFLEDPKNNKTVVETSCKDCHEVPDKTIERGFVEVNHKEFESYNVNCENSCHKKEISIVSEVSESVCLSCHSFTMEADANSIELHAEHSMGEKVECFACHGKPVHGQTQVASLSSMMDCQNCHTDTHQVQRTIYTADTEAHKDDIDKILSPMFLTHVECTGCHIEKTQKEAGVLDSMGTVAKAVPKACDNCHEPGTGDKYIPFWQDQIKELYANMVKKVDEFESKIKYENDIELALELTEKAKQARIILDSVELDGSWGVHNFKYAEAMLLKINGIID